MDMPGNKDEVERVERNEDHINYRLADRRLDWRFSSCNTAYTSMGPILTGDPISVGNGDLMESSSCSSASIVDSFCPVFCDQNSNSQHFGFSDNSVQNSTTTLNMLRWYSILGPPTTGIEIPLAMGWSPPNSMLKGGMFLPTTCRTLPQSLSNFPTDSGFIQRAARLSCFNAGNFGNIMNPFAISEFLGPCASGLASIQGQTEASGSNKMKSICDGPFQKTGVNMAEDSKDCPLSVATGIRGKSLCMNERSESLVRSNDESKQGLGVSGHESDEAEFSGKGGQEEPSMLKVTGGEPSSARRLGSKKRKRSGQHTELDKIDGALRSAVETPKSNTEIQQKGDQNIVSTVNKPNGKHGKQVPQALDSQKEEYIHVRARRGQATNSHSLAERMRREKISERMKLLQDLVPGCSKVIGKAVMLDEIINYVQSLQRQVEFLSMKLATINPRLDFNIEELLEKHVLQSRVGSGPSSSQGFLSDMIMTHPPLYPPHAGHAQPGLSGMGNLSDAVQGTINSQLSAMNAGHKEPPSRVSNVWEDELRNVIDMGFNSSAPLNSQDMNGHMRTEL